MSHLQRDPVFIHVRLYDVQLVIVQIPCCPPGRNAEDRRSVAAADAPPSIGQPFFATQITCIYQLLRLILQPQHHSFLPSSTPAAVPHASAREPLCGDTLQTAAAVLRDAISFLFSFGYRLSQKISSKPFGIWAQKERELPAAQILLRRGHSRNLWALRPKKKSGRNLSCGHGNSTGNRKSLTMRVQAGILRTLRLSCRKQYAQISITSQLYHKILWLSRKRRLTATRKSVLPGDIHTPEAAQNTAATGAESRHAPTGLRFLRSAHFPSAGAHPARHPPA